ncbi:MAG: MotA/TolQ/ExbB proton channel family protein [Candidatus Tectomicrobia bacterium]|uniref:MotA/TolQ/ExbB proton channel family protein n=1 Tax=Tectimicrobiota bacterium TaxID=2528274 RepID=A0A932CNH8_UNCTE|nr:MotA/TolQ/ExbB proton channel family protein [Candidatus Tectomicrobia bacterium]
MVRFISLLVLFMAPGGLGEAWAQGVEPQSAGWQSWQVVDIFGKGGITMYPILLCSILALAIALERAFHLRRSKIIPEDFLERLRRYWYRSEPQKAIEICQEHEVSFSRIMKAGLLRFAQGPAEMERAIEAAGQHEVSLLSNNLRFLGALSNLATMLGLLGTVLGMIKSFNVISQHGTGDPGLLASGIAEALITTAFGLLVGIPTLAAYHYFRGRVEKFVYEMEEMSLELLEDLAQKEAPEEVREVVREVS